MLWFLVTFLDLPVVLVIKFLRLETPFESPYIIFGLFGSLQYFIIGFVVSYILGRSNKKI
jgi:uncharacterized membrane protein (DUF485 family)